MDFLVVLFGHFGLQFLGFGHEQIYFTNKKKNYVFSLLIALWKDCRARRKNSVSDKHSKTDIVPHMPTVHLLKILNYFNQKYATLCSLSFTKNWIRIRNIIKILKTWLCCLNEIRNWWTYWRVMKKYLINNNLFQFL